MRGDEPSPTRSSVLVRLSHGHVRIGTFQRLAYLERARAACAGCSTIASRPTSPDAGARRATTRAPAFLDAVVERVARDRRRSWMAAGFVHGVLNTDNINITGESFDYGPWRFLPRYDPGFTAAYFDQTGLYAFGRQPDTLPWNLTRLAECLLPLARARRARRRRSTASGRRSSALAPPCCAGSASRPRRRGRTARCRPALFGFLEQPARRPTSSSSSTGAAAMLSAGRAARSPAADGLCRRGVRAAARRRSKAPARPARQSRPSLLRASQSPCTMLIDEIEALWAPIAERDDWSAFEAALGEIEAMRQAYRAARNPRSARAPVRKSAPAAVRSAGRARGSARAPHRSRRHAVSPAGPHAPRATPGTRARPRAPPHPRG